MYKRMVSLWSLVFIVFILTSCTSQNVSNSNSKKSFTKSSRVTLVHCSITVSSLDTLKANPGQTICIKDGLYHGQLLLNNLHGEATKPITIAAEHDGGVLIDGDSNPSNPAVLEVTNSSYVVVTGFRVQNGGRDVVGIYANTDHITVTRITASDAGRRTGDPNDNNGDNHVFDVGGLNDRSHPTDITIVDSAAYGGLGRYSFAALHASNVKFIRTYAEHPQSTYPEVSPRSCYGIYDSIYVSVINPICVNDFPDKLDTGQQHGIAYFDEGRGLANFYAVYITTDDNNTGIGSQEESHATIMGGVFYNNWDGIWVDSSAGGYTRIVNSMFYNHRKQGNYQQNGLNNNEAITWGSGKDTHGVIAHSTFVKNRVGVVMGDPPAAMNNCSFYNNNLDYNGSPQSANNFFGDDWPPNSDIPPVNPGYDESKYGIGAYMMIPESLKQKDIGADIRYQYDDNGYLTHTHLWPWPMEDRIKSETGASVTGSIWKTLKGVY